MKFKVRSDEGILDIRIKLTIRVNSGKSVIKDEIKLRRNLTSFNIENHMNSRGMDFANTEIDGTTTSSSPFRDFLPILEFCIEHIAGATKDM